MPLTDAAAGLKKRAKLFDQAATRLQTTKKQTPPEWAAANRVYGPDTGVPGARDLRLTPYMIEFELAFDNPKYNRVVMCCSSQEGKTDSILDVIGCRLDTRPAPVIYLGPSKEFLIDQFEPRLVELFRQSPSLGAKVLGGVDSKRQKKTLKRAAGTRVRLAHAGSTTATKSDVAAVAFADELDGMINVTGQSPLELLLHRGSTFANFVCGITSTPSVGSVDTIYDEASGLEFWKPALAEDLQSPIWAQWQLGTMHHFCWKCRHCSQYFVPRLKLLRWKKSEDKAIKTTPLEARRSAFVQCPNCGGVHTEADKRALNASGRHIAPGQTIDAAGNVLGDPPDTSTISFWVSGLCSPFVTFGERAENYLTAVRLEDPDKIRTSINQSFGEMYAPGGGETPTWFAVTAHKAEYARGEVPPGVYLIVLTVDVQRNSLIWLARGWGARAESWLIDWGVLHGSTLEQEVWDRLATRLMTPIGGIPIKKCLIDSGFMPKPADFPLNMVCAFCERFPTRVRRTKGASHPMRQPILKNDTIKPPQLLLDTDHWKSTLHEKVRNPTNVARWHLPWNVDEDFCRQIVSEARIKRAKGGAEWKRLSRENHMLDLEAMQLAAAYLFNALYFPEPATPAVPSVPPAVVPTEEPAAAPGTTTAAPAPDTAAEEAEEKKWDAYVKAERRENWLGGSDESRWNRRF